jgi:glycerol-3-phosphate dehydrogenase
MRKNVVIIGAGAVGCAIAREFLKNNPSLHIAVLEKNNGPGLETSQFNSGVVHSGLHLHPDSLKARFAKEGSKALVRYCEEKNLPHRKSGMLITASWQTPTQAIGNLYDLINLYKRGRSQQLKIKTFLTPWGIRKIEPNINALAAIYVPNVYIIDSVKYVRSLFDDARQAGAEFYFNHQVAAIENYADHYDIYCGEKTFSAETVVNAAGLYADEIAAMAGFRNYKIIPYRGEYYEVLDVPKEFIKTLVYPAYRPGQAGLGIHLTPKLDGRLLVGPNARRVENKSDYTTDKTSEDIFRKALATFCPALKNAKLEWAYSGIRAKIEGREPDFIIRVDSKKPKMINLIGIESPGLTASLAIANYVVNL